MGYSDEVNEYLNEDEVSQDVTDEADQELTEAEKEALEKARKKAEAAAKRKATNDAKKAQAEAAKAAENLDPVFEGAAQAPAGEGVTVATAPTKPIYMPPPPDATKPGCAFKLPSGNVVTNS